MIRIEGFIVLLIIILSLASGWLVARTVFRIANWKGPLGVPRILLMVMSFLLTVSFVDYVLIHIFILAT